MTRPDLPDLLLPPPSAAPMSAAPPPSHHKRHCRSFDFLEELDDRPQPPPARRGRDFTARDPAAGRPRSKSAPRPAFSSSASPTPPARRVYAPEVHPVKLQPQRRRISPFYAAEAPPAEARAPRRRLDVKPDAAWAAVPGRSRPPTPGEAYEAFPCAAAPKTYAYEAAGNVYVPVQVPPAPAYYGPRSPFYGAAPAYPTYPHPRGDAWYTPPAPAPYPTWQACRDPPSRPPLGANTRGFSKSWDDILAAPEPPVAPPAQRGRSYENLLLSPRPPSRRPSPVVVTLSTSPKRYAALSLSENSLPETKSAASSGWFVTPEITIADNDIGGGEHRPEEGASPCQRRSAEHLDELLTGLALGGSEPFSESPPEAASPDASGSEDDDEESVLTCANARCGRADSLFQACLYFKSCPRCRTLYCSRHCRRQDWAAHRERCLLGRAAGVCRRVLRFCRRDPPAHRALSRVARVGFLSRGRGVLFLGFAGPAAAEDFLRFGLEGLPAPPAYLSLREIGAANLGNYPGIGNLGAGNLGGYPGIGNIGSYPGIGNLGSGNLGTYPVIGNLGGYPGIGNPGSGNPGGYHRIGNLGSGNPGGYPGIGIHGSGNLSGYPGSGISAARSHGGYPGSGVGPTGSHGGYPGSGNLGYPASGNLSTGNLGGYPVSGVGLAGSLGGYTGNLGIGASAALRAVGEEYDPSECFLLHVSVGIGGGSGERAVRRLAKVALASAPAAPSSSDGDLETLILTPPPGSGDLAAAGSAGRRAREVCFVHIQRELRARGVGLRREFPGVYARLCSFVESGGRFAPTAIYPVDRRSGRPFLCLIMAASEPRPLDWVASPDLLDELM